MIGPTVEAEELLLAYVDNAKKIVSMCERNAPGYPTDDRECWSTPNTVTTYNRLKINSAIYAELDKNSKHSADEKIGFLTKILFDLDSAINQGRLLIMEKHGFSRDDADLHFTRPQFLSCHLLDYFPDVHEVHKRYLYFFVLTLHELLYFEKVFSSAFIAPKEWSDLEARENSYQDVINAMGSLLVSQESFEWGVRCMEYSLSKEEKDVLAKRIDAEDNRRIKGGENSKKKLKPLRGWVKEQAKMYFDTDPDKKLKSGKVADELRSDVISKKEKFSYLGGNVPTHKWFRDEVAKNAPDYANTRGPSTK